MPNRPDGSRAWHLKWDPEGGQWVAENPGSGTTGSGDLSHLGEPGSFGYDVHGNRMPYANNRPPYAPDQVNTVFEQARDENGEVWVQARDGSFTRVEWEPGTPREGIWDMGHVPTAPYRDLRELYLSKQITVDEFLRRYRDPSAYRVEDPSRNRARIDESG